MGHTLCTEPQCLYKGALYLYHSCRSCIVHLTLHQMLVIGCKVTTQIIWSNNISQLHCLRTVHGDSEIANTEHTLKYTDVYCSLLLASLVWVSWSITSTICHSDWRSCTHYWSHRKGMALCWTSLCKIQQNLEEKIKMKQKHIKTAKGAHLDIVHTIYHTVLHFTNII